jgi:hypothetical protein
MDMFCCLKLAALHLFGKRARRRALKTSLSLGFHEKACAAGKGRRSELCLMVLKRCTNVGKARTAGATASLLLG